MCFFIHPTHREVKVAKRDITCYKEGDWHGDDSFAPAYRSYCYKLGKVDKIKGVWPKPAEVEMGNIYIGFHSYSNKKKLCGSPAHWAVCMIPKGARYYYDPDWKEYVSDTIVIVRRFV